MTKELKGHPLLKIRKAEYHCIACNSLEGIQAVPITNHFGVYSLTKEGKNQNSQLSFRFTDTSVQYSPNTAQNDTKPPS